MPTLSELAQQPLQQLLGSYWITKPDGTPDFATMGSTEFFNTLPPELRQQYTSVKAGAQLRDAQIAQDARGVIGDKWITKADGSPDYAAMSTPDFFNTLDANQRTQYTGAQIGKKFNQLGAGYTAPLDPVGHAQVGSQQNWEWNVSPQMGDPQMVALARGDSADQAKLLQLLGPEAGHSLINQVMLQQGTGRAPGQSAYGASSTSDPLTEGVATLPDAVRQMYEQNGILSGGKWAKTQDANGQWIANPAFSAAPATTPPPVTGTTPPPTTGATPPPVTTAPPTQTPTQPGGAPGADSTIDNGFVKSTYTAPERGEYNKTPFDFFNDAGYQFQLGEGTKGIQNSAAARGSLQSGNTLKSLAKYQTGLASNEFGKAYDRYSADRNFAEGQFTGDRAFGRGAYENNRNFDYGAYTGTRDYNNANRIDARNFDYGAAVGERNFNYAKDVDNRNFGYTAATGDRTYNTNTLMDLARMGLTGSGASGNLASELARILSGNTLIGAGAGANATVGNANNTNSIISQILSYLNGNATVNAANGKG